MFTHPDPGSAPTNGRGADGTWGLKTRVAGFQSPKILGFAPYRFGRGLGVGSSGYRIIVEQIYKTAQSLVITHKL